MLIVLLSQKALRFSKNQPFTAVLILMWLKHHWNLILIFLSANYDPTRVYKYLDISRMNPYVLMLPWYPSVFIYKNYQWFKKTSWEKNTVEAQIMENWTIRGSSEYSIVVNRDQAQSWHMSLTRVQCVTKSETEYNIYN